MSVPAEVFAGDALGPVQRRFVMHWGEMGSRWGVNRTVAQVHALLFLSAVPLHAERIAEVLQVARSNVSTSLKELQNLNLVRVVHLLGDRRDHFETGHDAWELMRTVVRERKAREFDPTVGVLADFLADPALAQEPPEVRKRIADTHGLMLAMSNWGEQMLRLEPSTLMKVMKLGAKIQKLLEKKVSEVAYPLTLYVDDACPLCHAEMAGLVARDANACLRMLDASTPGFAEAAAQSAGLDQATLLHRLHARDANGRWLVGVPVFAAAYEAAGIHWLTRLLRVRWLRPLWDAGYALVADHRWLLVKLGGPRLVAALLAPKNGTGPISHGRQ